MPSHHALHGERTWQALPSNQPTPILALTVYVKCCMPAGIPITSMTQPNGRFGSSIHKWGLAAPAGTGSDGLAVRVPKFCVEGSPDGLLNMRVLNSAGSSGRVELAAQHANHSFSLPSTRMQRNMYTHGRGIIIFISGRIFAGSI